MCMVYTYNTYSNKSFNVTKKKMRKKIRIFIIYISVYGSVGEFVVSRKKFNFKRKKYKNISIFSKVCFVMSFFSFCYHFINVQFQKFIHPLFIFSFVFDTVVIL